MSRILGESSRSEAVVSEAAERQRRVALSIMKERPDLRLLVLSHTHRSALIEVESGRWYLNPGPWMDEHRFAVVTDRGPELRVFDP